MPASLRARRVVFGIVLASFVLSFFHRTAPAAIAAELTRAFAISAAMLGTLAATYFYVYTLLQIPVGVLADTLGPRRILAAGSLIAGAGSLAFALAPTWEIAAVGRTLVGVGVSVAFIAILKISAVWFPANRFATLDGVTMFAGNLGRGHRRRAARVDRHADVVAHGVRRPARAVARARASATWWRVRDRPEELGFAPVHAHAPATVSGVHWTRAARRCSPIPRRGRASSSTSASAAAISPSPDCGQCRTWAGLRHVARRAAQHASVLLLGVAFGSLAIGAISDRLRSRRG